MRLARAVNETLPEKKKTNKQNEKERRRREGRKKIKQDRRGHLVSRHKLFRQKQGFGVSFTWHV